MKSRLAMLVSLLIGSLASFASPARAADIRSIIFPILGRASYSNDFGAPRVGHTHQGNDIFAAKHTPLLAAVDGVVQYVTWPEASYGYFISLRDSDGYEYWYIHINNDNPGTDDGRGGGNFAYAPGIDNGQPVVKGQIIGWVGDSGNAETTAPHLHFEIHRPDGNVINPYLSLNAATRVRRAATAPILDSEYLPFGQFPGGSSMALADLDASQDGSELVLGAGFGGGPLVRIVNTYYGQISKFYAYDQSFHGGVEVAAGDVNGDGQIDIVTAPRSGSEGMIRVFTPSGTLLSQFLAYPPGFRGGVNIAVADLDGDGLAEIITSPGRGWKPDVHVYRFTGVVLTRWLAYTTRFEGGVDVAALPADQRGHAGMIVTGALRGGGPEVRTFSMDGTNQVSFYAYDANFRGGVTVAAHRYPDGSVSLWTVPFSGGGSQLNTFTEDGHILSSQFVFERWWRGGFSLAADDTHVLMATNSGGRRTTIRAAAMTSPAESVEPSLDYVN